MPDRADTSLRRRVLQQRVQSRRELWLFVRRLVILLGAVAGANEEGVGSFNDHEALDADGRDEFAGAPEEIAFGVDRLMKTPASISWTAVATIFPTESPC